MSDRRVDVIDIWRYRIVRESIMRYNCGISLSQDQLTFDKGIHPLKI